MMKSPRPEKDKKIEDIIIKYVRNLFRLTKENEAIKDRVIAFLSMKKKIIRNQ